MTAIAAVRDAKGNVWLGADGQGTGGGTCYFDRESKIFTRQGVGFAICGSVRFWQLLQYEVAMPVPPKKDPMVWIVRQLIPAVRKTMDAAGWTKKDQGQEDVESNFMVVTCGRVFTVWANWQVGEARGPYTANGSGMHYVLAALEAQAKKVKPKERLMRALRIAGKYSSSVGPPYQVVAFPRKG